VVDLKGDVVEGDPVTEPLGPLLDQQRRGAAVTGRRQQLVPVGMASTA
jgi:hypothetical protein